MKNTTVLTVMGPESPLDDLKQMLDEARDANLHLAVLIVDKNPTFPFYEAGIPPYGTFTVPQDWQDKVGATQEALAAKQEEISTLLANSDVSADVKTVIREAPLIKDAVAERAILSDIAHIASALRQDNTVFRNTLYGLLFGSPVGVMLNTVPHAHFDHVLVAWNTSLPAARAVQQALPILKAAKQVTIATFDPDLKSHTNPGSDAAKWLSHHGCNVTVQQYPSGGLDVGAAILDRTNDLGADLIVAGAYGKSRLREDIFGGTSDILIKQTDRPVFLAH